MPTTLSTLLSAVRSVIDEVSTRYWTDPELTTWLNDGCRDIARRAEVIQQFNTSVVATAAVAKYSLPTNVIRVHRVEYIPTGQVQVHVLQASTEQELDGVFGTNPDQQGAYPQFYTIWGYPGGTGAAELKMRVYPVPAIGGVFNLYYYAVPTPMLLGTDVAQIPEGWQDLLVLYCEFTARRKDRQAEWADAKQLYDQKIEELIEVTRHWHDQAGSVSVGGTMVPGWLYNFDA